jgi:FkbM family methyltransferase
MSFDAIESLLRRTANRCGLDLRRYRPDATETGRLATMLRHHDVDWVLDVGANVGQFASRLRGAGYAGRILSFEPLGQAHERLLAASRNDERWEIAPRVAIGDSEGETDLHVSGNSVSSSILDMLDRHANSACGSRYVATERVRLSTLDSMTMGKLGAAAVPFVKIDTQGYEDRVLNGAQNVLAKARGLQLELSFVPLYEGQQLFEPLMDRLRSLGFSVWAIWPGFCEPTSGRMLQADVILFRD